MKRLLVTLTIIFGTFVILHADVFEDRIVRARTLLASGFNSWNEVEMQESLAQFQRLLMTGQERWLLHFYVAFADYRLGTFFLEKDADRSKKYIHDAKDHLETSLKLNDSFPESYALMSSCFGYEIGLAPWKGMVLGPRSGMYISEAVSLGPQNPRVWLLKGIGTNFTPKIFGGGKEKAVEELKKAIQLYEQEEPVPLTYPQWGYDEAYAWLGLILQELGRLDAAKAAFENGLKVNPQSGWIRMYLLPELNKEMDQK